MELLNSTIANRGDFYLSNNGQYLLQIDFDLHTNSNIWTAKVYDFDTEIALHDITLNLPQIFPDLDWSGLKMSKVTISDDGNHVCIIYFDASGNTHEILLVYLDDKIPIREQISTLSFPMETMQ